MATPSWAAGPYTPTLSDPMGEIWRWRSFPELKELGLRSMASDPEGSMWFGADDGVLRYDGIEWRSFGAAEGLPDVPVNALCATAAGQVYAGTDMGIFQHRPDGEAWSRVFPLASGIPWPVDRIIEAADGSLWAATAWGGLRGVGGEWTLYTSEQMAATVRVLEPGVGIIAVPDAVVPAYEWPRGVGVKVLKGGYIGTGRGGVPMTVWALAPGGPAERAGLKLGDQVTSINGTVSDLPHLVLDGLGTSARLKVTRRDTAAPLDLEIEFAAVHGSFSGFSVSDVLEGRDGRIWLGLSWGGQIVCYRPSAAGLSDAEWTLHGPETGMTPGDRPRLTQTRDGALWVVSNHFVAGVNRLAGGVWEHFRLSDEGGNDINTAILETSDGTLWIGSHSGLIQTFRNGQWKTWRPSEIPVSQSRITEMLETPDGAVWIAGLGQEATRLDYDTQRWRSYEELDFGAETPDGGMWFTAARAAVVRHRPHAAADERWTEFGVDDGLMDSPAGLLATKAGELWVGGSSGQRAATARLTDGGWELKLHSRLSNGIDGRALLEAADGSLWFGANVGRTAEHVGGLVRYSPDDGTWEHHGPPTTLAHTYGIGQTADGQVWVGGSGLRRFDGERWAIVAEPRGLASWIHGIIPANDGGLWVGTRTYGLFHFGDGEWTRYGVREGLSNNTIRAILQTPDSTVWVATDKGVDRFDGRTWTTHALPGDLQTVKNISSLRRSKDGAIWIGVTGGTIRYYPEEDAPETEIDVHPTKVSQPGNTSFAWSGSDPWRATADEDLEYAWRLDGGDWSAFTRETSRVLLALPGGEHSFEVRARDRDHNADPTPARSVFTVVPPIWRQAWFVGTLTALFVAIAVQSWRVIRRDRALHQSNRFLRQRSEDLEAANRRTKEADRLKSRFLANMSHELRTPLNAILGFAQIMNRDRSSTAEQRERLEIIERNGQHLLTLINDVLDVSKIEAGSATLSRTNFDLFALLDGVEEMFQLRAEAKGLQLTAERADGLPQFVRSDAGKLRQVLINLLGNAVKFTESGSVSVRLGHADSHADSHPACRLLFEVVDTGPGIGPEEAERLFDAFAQTEAGSRAGEGTGLGLAISQEFVQLLGGKIAVHPTAQGTRFTFDIEVEVVARSDVDVKPARRRVMGLEPGQPSFRILVVEDVAENRRLLGELLTPLGFEVREARDGQEGLAEWERWEPHLIWMDMRMPVMDGHEATRRIKATTRGQATVVIALTASAFDEDRAVVLSEGCDAFVRKPFREEEIFDVLATHLGVKFVYDEEPDAPASAAPEALPAQLVESDLAGASPDWRAAVGTAAVRADDEELLRLIAEIAAQNPKLADGLASLVHDFRFDRISALCGGQS